jgi:hypothetical protein
VTRPAGYVPAGLFFYHGLLEKGGRMSENISPTVIMLANTLLKQLVALDFQASLWHYARL